MDRIRNTPGGGSAIPPRTIARLSLYRRVLAELPESRNEHIFSRELAERAGVTAAQVRRDIMAIGGHAGNPARGYDVKQLLRDLSTFLDAARGQGMALVGVGNLGKAILGYFVGRNPKLSIEAAFDVDPAKTNRVIHRCRCYPVDELVHEVGRRRLRVGIITVPAPAAQPVADRLCEAGVRGLVNFAPVRLSVPDDVFVEDIDMSMVLEKVAFFARHHPKSAADSTG